jgi:hypothetical protein
MRRRIGDDGFEESRAQLNANEIARGGTREIVHGKELSIDRTKAESAMRNSKDPEFN